MSALATLIESKLASRGWKLSDLAHAVAPKNPNKTLGKLQALMCGGRCSKPHAHDICRALEITKAEQEEAVRADRAAWWDTVAEEQRQHFTPHLWIEVSPDWFPSLVTFLGAEFFRRVEVPKDLVILNDESRIIQRAGGLVAAHYQSKKCRVGRDSLVSYLYRREFQLAYRFEPNGCFSGLETKRVLAPVTRWRVS